MLDKIIKRMEQSKQFKKVKKCSDYGKYYSSYIFDDGLEIDSYNGLLRVVFKGETVDHYHGKKYNNGIDDGKDKLWDIIYKKRDSKKNDILSQL